MAVGELRVQPLLSTARSFLRSSVPGWSSQGEVHDALTVAVRDRQPDFRLGMFRG